jgi:hypothetical protein
MFEESAFGAFGCQPMLWAKQGFIMVLFKLIPYNRQVDEKQMI